MVHKIFVSSILTEYFEEIFSELFLNITNTILFFFHSLHEFIGCKKIEGKTYGGFSETIETIRVAIGEV